MRDLLIELSSTGLFRAKWTNEIHDEWMRNLLANRPDLRPEQLDRTRRLMDESSADSLLDDAYKALVPALELPDPDDRHVLAAAVSCQASAIVTFNLADFPAELLKRFNIEAQHPDDFVFHQLGLDDASVLISAQRCRKRLRKPPLNATEYLDVLERQALPRTVAELRKYAAIL